ncbi:glycyl-radical enzyme activating protein [Pontiella sulfatireligans]|uniref:Benzylsuccinate synthase activating enzyme n=1 Tax=Pontiella sulfatireligans TaxID=2750658 RepID=A0A6C2UK52_9BACT|nr:glycyl-radical enzyme activating protein [Pontiella sulfatireligans]VGO19576.1 Benzylsuccinate synthase activating enzyme [Pontiella sulfatireligans]
MNGIIFDIKRFAVHDGPGIRTTLFLKGCPLRCAWCQNPEGLCLEKQLWWFKSKCIFCRKCLPVCPESVRAAVDGEIRIDRRSCIKCGTCVETCPTGAMEFDGREISVEEAVAELQKDQVFYDVSGGGITLSGGDPLFQHEFAEAVLRGSKEAGLHTAVETSLAAEWGVIEKMRPHVDLWICDLKEIDSKKHQEFTGQPNERIFENFKQLAAAGAKILVRIPVIPGFTDRDDNVQGIAEFVRSVRSDIEIELMNYNPLAPNKYRLMQKSCPLDESVQPLSVQRMEELEQWTTM